MKRITKTALVLMAGLVFGYKATPPQVAAKWHRTNQLSATYMTPGGSQPHHDSAQVDFILVLTQNGQTVQGDAAIASGKSHPIYIPITTWEGGVRKDYRHRGSQFGQCGRRRGPQRCAHLGVQASS